MISSIKKCFFVLAIGLSILHTGCEKLITVESPNTSLTSENIYTNDATAASVLTGIYELLNKNSPLAGAGISSISLTAGLSADELDLFGGASNANSALTLYYLNRLSPSNSSGIWYDCYPLLYEVNIALEKLSVSRGLTPAVKQQLTGEARFLRAFFFFYLVNLYGEVPLTTSSDYTINSTLSRSSQDLVYQQIIADLIEAKNLLSNNYVASDAMTPTTERVRPNKWAATSLLARVYLYKGNWADAEAQATAVINNSSLYNLGSLNEVFWKNSTEAIWQLQPVNQSWNTENARVFIIPSTGPTLNSPASGTPVYISSHLFNNFESGDQRRVNWIGNITVNGVTYYYPFKYRSAILNAPVTEYETVFRLAEQYLIRAEARAKQNNIDGAASDLNIVRSRAGLTNSTSNSQSTLLYAILHERQVELFTEWGHRWLDLKRTGNLDGVMNVVAVAKGTTWSQNWQFYPIPASEIIQDPKLVQNTGY